MLTEKNDEGINPFWIMYFLGWGMIVVGGLLNLIGIMIIAAVLIITATIELEVVEELKKLNLKQRDEDDN